MNEKQGSAAVKWLKHRIVPIFLTFIILFYIAYSTVDIKLDDKSGLIFDFSLKLLITLIFGLTITSLVSDGGYATGREDPDYIATRDEAVRLTNEILPWKDEAEEYVIGEIEKKVKFNRETIIKSIGLKYEEVFDDNGKCIFDFKSNKYNRRQRKAVKKACKIVRKPFVLLAYSEADALGFEEAPSETKRRSKKAVSKLVSRAIFAFVSGSIMFESIGWNWQAFVYVMSQLFIWLGTGIAERLDNYNFITVKMRDYDKSRIGYMKAFLAMKKGE